MSSHTLKRWLIPVGGVLVLFAVVGVAQGWFKWWPFGKDTKVSDMRVQGYLDESIEHALIEFERSRAIPLGSGDSFPVLDYPILRGNEPDWSKPAVITFGSVKSESTHEFYATIKESAIQKIHVISWGEHTPEYLQRFPEDVTVLGASEDMVAESLNMADDVYQKIGINQPWGYLVDHQRTILYAVMTRAEVFPKFAEVVREFLNGGQGLFPNDPMLFLVGQSLPLNAIPEAFREEVLQELSKPLSLVLFSNPTWCNICRDWLNPGKSFIQQWRDNGYGLLLVEGGAKAFALERRSDGILKLSDVQKPDSEVDSIILESWLVSGVPKAYVLKEGTFQGKVGWIELDIDGKPYRDIFFKIVDRAIAQVSQ